MPKSEFTENVFIQNIDTLNMENPKDTILFYQQRIYFLEKMIELKDKEIEARDRDIKIFKELVEELKSSRNIITSLYERKIEDLKRTIEILQGNKLS